MEIHSRFTLKTLSHHSAHLITTRYWSSTVGAGAPGLVGRLCHLLPGPFMCPALAQRLLSLIIPTCLHESVRTRALWTLDPDTDGSPLPPAAWPLALIARQGLLGAGLGFSALTGMAETPPCVPSLGGGGVACEPPAPQKAREEGTVQCLVSSRGKMWVIGSRLKCGLAVPNVIPLP